jgi:hypothetical protein
VTIDRVLDWQLRLLYTSTSYNWVSQFFNHQLCRLRSLYHSAATWSSLYSLGTDPIENAALLLCQTRPQRKLQLSHCCSGHCVRVHCQATSTATPSVCTSLLPPWGCSSRVAYPSCQHFLLTGGELPEVASAPTVPARKPPIASPSSSGGVTQTSFVGWFSRCCSPTPPANRGPLAVFLRAGGWMQSLPEAPLWHYLFCFGGGRRFHSSQSPGSVAQWKIWLLSSRLPDVGSSWWPCWVSSPSVVNLVSLSILSSRYRVFCSVSGCHCCIPAVTAVSSPTSGLSGFLARH